MSLMRDRFYYGFIAGVLAGIPMVLFNLFSYYILHFGSLRYLDWMSVLMYGHFPLSTFDTVLAQLIHFGLLGFLGLLFAYFIPLVTSKHYLFKGWVYSMAVFVVLYSLMVLYKVPGLVIVDSNTVLANLISSSIFGLCLAEAIKRLVSTESPD